MLLPLDERFWIAPLPKKTVLLLLVEKFEPVIVTCVPTWPDVGEIDEIIGVPPLFEPVTFIDDVYEFDCPAEFETVNVSVYVPEFIYAWVNETVWMPETTCGAAWFT
jgi:hypothetical protein